MKIEMHIHTSEASPCGTVHASKLPQMYQDAGYDAIVITDHYALWAQERNHFSSATEYTEFFLDGYRTAKRAGDAIGLPVFPGAEINLPGSPNDYLIYGAEPEFFQAHPDLYTRSLPECYKICHENGLLLFQAHPFRSYCTPADPKWLDGAEAHNGNPRHSNHNDQAADWVRQHKLIASSGSDFHEPEDLAVGGIETYSTISNIHELCQVLLSGNYRLLGT